MKAMDVTNPRPANKLEVKTRDKRKNSIPAYKKPYYFNLHHILRTDVTLNYKKVRSVICFVVGSYMHVLNCFLQTAI